MRKFALAITLARRDLRGGFGTFWILVLGIALGVAAIAAAGSVADAVLEGVRGGARESIGGDVTLRLFHHPATPEQREVLQDAGRHSETAELRPLAHRSDGSAAALVELKAVDDSYPLYGAVRLEPARDLASALARHDGRWGAVVDQALLDALDLRLGDTIRLGGIAAEIRGLIRYEPDRAFRALSLGPRVMITRSALDDTGLAPPGAQVYWYNHVRLPQGADPAAWIAATETRLPQAGWRIVNADDGVPGIERVVLIGRALLVLIGLSVLLIGGVGVAAAVSAHLSRKTATIAILKSLGADGGLIFTVFLLQVLAAAGLGTILGLAAGGAVLCFLMLGRLMPEGWLFLPSIPVTLSAMALAMMLATALFVGRRALARPPAEVLRQRLPI